MPQIINQKLLSYNIDKLYNIIIDVERYPEFIPWFKKIKIISMTNSAMITDVTVEFMFIKDHYTSTAKLIEPHQVKGETIANVTITMLEGPFDHFHTIWSLKAIDEDSCFVDFKCDYSFNNKLYDNIALVVLKSMNKKIMDAFIKRIVAI
jgi:coenzyme Q-binding protein COQ10